MIYFKPLPFSCSFCSPLLLTIIFFFCPISFAQLVIVNTDNNLQLILDNASNGDTIELAPGIYSGNFTIDHAITLRGLSGAIIDAQGQHNAIRVKASNVKIENLHIRNWGDDLTLMNAGIFVEKQAENTHIQNNTLKGDVTGIWLNQCPGSKVINNRIEGNLDLRSVDRGNGIHLSLVTNTEVRGNEIWFTRDGIYINASNHNQLIDNKLHDLRYGIHYMYSYHNKIINNHAKKVKAGYALMQSKHLTVINNTSEESIDYGLLLNFITDSTLTGNNIYQARQPADSLISGAEGKALFVYNSFNNKIENNRFSESDIGIHLTAGSENNSFSNNSFINNTTQVKYVASRKQEWSQNNQGNYWSNYLGWDMNNDGIGDTAFEPNDNIDRLLWKYPQAKLIMHSPSIFLLRWVQKQFPVLKAQGVKDSFPLMHPPIEIKQLAALSGDLS